MFSSTLAGFLDLPTSSELLQQVNTFSYKEKINRYHPWVDVFIRVFQKHETNKLYVCVCARVCCAVLSHSVVSDSLWLQRLQPGSSVHGDSPGKNTAVGCHTLLQRIFPTQGLNLGLPHFRQFLYHLNHQGSPRILEWVTYPFSRGSSPPRNQTGVSRIAEVFFTSWGTREARVCVCVCVCVCARMHACTRRDLLLGLDSHNYGCSQVSAFTADWIFRRADDINFQPKDQWDWDPGGDDVSVQVQEQEKTSVPGQRQSARRILSYLK